jgi:hypothetical protein
MGNRDMEDQLDRLNKQNFALKLEIDHRRDTMQKLQEQLSAMREQVERAEKVEEEHAELLRINSQLVEELEKRDRAIEEAMDIICDLEERVNDLEETNSNTRPSTAHADSGYAGTELHEQDSPKHFNAQPQTPRIALRQAPLPASVASQNLQGLVNGQTPARLKREPQILTQQKPSTRALRSVYLENARELHPVKSFQSFLTRQDSKLDDEADDVLNSPRLSVLSESSFPSIYSPKKEFTQDHFDWERVAEDENRDSPRSHPRQDSIKRVSQWISEHDGSKATPSKSNSISRPMQDPEDGMAPPPASTANAALTHFQSLNDALTAATSKPMNGIDGEIHRLKRRPQPGRPRHAQASFGESMLPPTPDSVSTRMLRDSRSSINDDRSLLDTTPATVRGFDALEPDVRTAPKQMRSSVELRTAYDNLQHRYQAPEIPDFIHDSSDDEEFGDADRLAERGLEFGSEFDCPDGKSIKLGTPRRLYKGPQGLALFDGSDMSFLNRDWSPPRQRKASENRSSSTPAKPRLSRAETSPTFSGTPGRMIRGSGKASTSTDTVTSPRSAHSASSGNQTVTPGEPLLELRDISPDAAPERSRMHSSVASPNRSRTSPSPARILGQKTQNLFRRLSNSQGSVRDVSPLPTLTSTPSSAYVETIPIEVRRPMTSHGTPRPAVGNPSVLESPGLRELQHPTLQSGTKTDPNSPRPPSAAGQSEATDRGKEKEKRSLFKRSNSVKHAADNKTSTDSRRRGSIRDAVSTARRPWR